MILPDRHIERILLGGHSAVTVPESRKEFGPIKDSQIQPASLDVRLARDFRDYVTGEQLPFRHADDTFFLGPGECVLACLVERFAMPRFLVGKVEGKSSWARKFLTTHAAGFIDPGFRGDITLELKNDGRMSLELRPGDVIAQVAFHQLSDIPQRLYGSAGLGSHYQGQAGATRSAS